MAHSKEANKSTEIISKQAQTTNLQFQIIVLGMSKEQKEKNMDKK